MSVAVEDQKYALLKKLDDFNKNCQMTSVRSVDLESIRLHVKLEFENSIGGSKCRTAYWALKKAIEENRIHSKSVLIESSSGNFACALANICGSLGLKFIPVIDPLIQKHYEDYLSSKCETIVKVVPPTDYVGGFLKLRLDKVSEMLDNMEYAVNIDQYNNLDCIDAHYSLTADELVRQIPEIDYVFVGVSTGGTIAGISKKVKQVYPAAKVVAVDIKGSIAFGGAPGKRYIPGIGSGIIPPFLKHALIDDVIYVTDLESVEGCHELKEKYDIWAGGSSGSVYYAIKKYFQMRPDLLNQTHKIINVAFLCADSGNFYSETVYNQEWVSKIVE